MLAGLAGLLEGGESEGALRVDGLDPRAARDRTGIVFQDPESQLVMAHAGDEVAFGLENRCVPAAEIWPRVDEALAAVGFPYGRDRPTDALSGGEQQRLALAGTLALQPGLLLLDEPTANLDPDGAALVRDALAAGGGRRRTDAGAGRASGRGGVAARGSRDRAAGWRWCHRRWFAGGTSSIATATSWRRPGSGCPDHPLPIPARVERPTPATVVVAARGRLPFPRREGPRRRTGGPGAAIGRGPGDRRAERIGQVDPGAAARRNAAAHRSARWRRAGCSGHPERQGRSGAGPPSAWRAGSDRCSRIRSTSS